jgi:hypothetical protein
MSIHYGIQQIDYSITNSSTSTTDIRDYSTPYSFLDFIKIYKGANAPEDFNVAYQTYLQRWHSVKNDAGATSDDIIKEMYINLFKEISINYTTIHEKKFLENVDFDDDVEVQVIIPFLARKLKNICLLYVNKRENAKFSITKNQIKGTQIGIEKYLYNLVIDYIFSAGVNYSLNSQALSAIKNNLDISIEEFFDTYSDYYDLDARVDKEEYNINSIRSELFSANTNTLEVDLFVDFNKRMLEEITRGVVVFLKSLGKSFSINYNINTERDLCDPDGDIIKLINSEDSDQNIRLRLKKRLYEKLLGTNVYYLSTNSVNDTLSGVLIKADAPFNNLLNVRNATTATIESKQLERVRNVGLFFSPQKSGVIQLNEDHSYIIDKSTLTPNSVYVFPDPQIYGNITNTSKKVYDSPLIYTIYPNCRRTAQFGYSLGDPCVTQSDQTFHGYFSTSQIFNSKYNVFDKLNELYNEGIITSWKSDIYGNQYGLLKHTPLKSSVNIKRSDSLNILRYLNSSILTDHPTLTDINAATDADKIYNFWYINESSYSFNISVSSNVVNTFYDGARFTDTYGVQLREDIRVFNPGWSESVIVYYNIFGEAGLTSTGTRPTSAVAADMETSQSTTLSSLSAHWDGGKFIDTYILGKNEISIPYIDSVDSEYSSVLDSAPEYDTYTPAELKELVGKVYVKNVETGNVETLSSFSAKIFDKYPALVKSEIYDDVLDFDIIYDRLIIKTQNYLVIDKIKL